MHDTLTQIIIFFHLTSQSGSSLSKKFIQELANSTEMQTIKNDF